MKLAGVAMVRNEADIIEVFVRHNLQSLDVLYVVDHRSDDGTREILRALEAERLALHLEFDEEAAQRQPENITRLARRAFVEGAEAVIPLDADEFLQMPDRVTFDRAVAAVPSGFSAALEWRTYVPEIRPDSPHPLAAAQRRRASETHGLHKIVLTDAFKLTPGAVVGPGNHTVLMQGADQNLMANPVALTRIHASIAVLAHFPARSAEQLVRKIIGGWEAHCAAARKDSTLAFHWGELHREFKTQGKPSPSRLRQIALNYGVPMSRWQPESAIPAVRDPLPTTAPVRYARLARRSTVAATGQGDASIGPSTVADDDGARTTTHSSDALSATNAGPTPAPRRRYFTIVAPTPGQPHAAVVAELSETLLQGLRSLRHDAEVAYGQYGPGINLLLSPTFAREALPPPPPGTIVYNLEQFDPSSSWFTERVRAVLREHVVWDYSAKNLQKLQSAGLALRGTHVPIGYAPHLTRIPRAPVQDIDVLFYGSMNARREDILRDLGRHGLKVMHAFNAYGGKRDALIARAKVLLNIHYYAAQVFEIVRVSYLLANSKAVVAEIGPDTDLDEDLIDAVAGVPYNGMRDAALALVRDDRRRHALETRGFEAFSKRSETAILDAALARMSCG